MLGDNINQKSSKPWGRQQMYDPWVMLLFQLDKDNHVVLEQAAAIAKIFLNFADAAKILLK